MPEITLTFPDGAKRSVRKGITGRELFGLIMAGYRLEQGHASLGKVMVCRDLEKARAFSLLKYNTALDFIERGISGNGRYDMMKIALRANIIL